MAYLKIDNLYKNQDVLLFKECYVLEKIHGTSAHIRWKKNVGTEFGNLGFFSGGVKHEAFEKLFNIPFFIDKFTELNIDEVTIYGEAYGGSCQGMKETYGEDLKFIAFDVKIGDCWLNVEKADNFVKQFDIEFVWYTRVVTLLSVIDSWRDAPSTQAQRNHKEQAELPDAFKPTFFKMAEGIVIRPIVEVVKNNGKRIIAKHKRLEFSETKTPREVNPDKLKQLAVIKDICIEWVTEARLSNVISNMPYIEELELSDIGKIIPLMTHDVLEEGKGELVDSRDLRVAIGRETALMIKRRISNKVGLS